MAEQNPAFQPNGDAHIPALVLPVSGLPVEKAGRRSALIAEYGRGDRYHHPRNLSEGRDACDRSLAVFKREPGLTP